MRKVFISFIFVLAILGIAFATCPTKSDFKDFVSARIGEYIEKENEKNEGGLLGNLLSPMLAETAGLIASESAEEQKFGVCNLYTVKYKKKEYRYLGAFTTFIPLQADNILDEIGK